MGGGLHKKYFFTLRNIKKKLMSKNGIKNRLALLFRELWAFLFFRKNKINAKGWRRKKGGRGVIFFYQKNVFIHRNIKSQCPKMVSNNVYLYYLRSYEHFLLFRNKIRHRGWLWSKWFFRLYFYSSFDNKKEIKEIFK